MLCVNPLLWRRGQKPVKRSGERTASVHAGAAKGEEQIMAIVHSKTFAEYDEAVQDLRKEIKKAKRDVKRSKGSSSSLVTACTIGVNAYSKKQESSKTEAVDHFQNENSTTFITRIQIIYAALLYLWIKEESDMRVESLRKIPGSPGSPLPTVNMGTFIAYFPAWVKFHELYRLGAYTHPFDFIAEQYSNDLKVSSDYVINDHPWPGFDGLKSSATPFAFLTPAMQEGSALADVRRYLSIVHSHVLRIAARRGLINLSHFAVGRSGHICLIEEGQEMAELFEKHGSYQKARDTYLASRNTRRQLVYVDCYSSTAWTSKVIPHSMSW
ncbi:hypothetical protein HJFPF1_01541 [Paramyrothecium foliicola]|nr:hypothetical protein HJFPF1_01541 [Paramyrothecium foliicola]